MITGPIHAALKGDKRFAGKAYFFTGGQYIRYDWSQEREDPGFPLPLTAWTLPSSFLSGVDAALDGAGPFAGNAYFFKGGQYLRYSWAGERVDLGPQPLTAWKLPAGFLSGIDAALNGAGPFAGKAYFFKGGQYVRYDWKSGKVDLGPQALSAWNLPVGFLAGVDAALSGAGKFTGKAYFFKGGQYVRYDWKSGKVDLGPRPIKGNWRGPRGLTIWANTLDVPITVCDDARLGGKNGPLSYPAGDLTGQAGWDMGLSFSNLSDLATKLALNPVSPPHHVCGRSFLSTCPPIQPGQITRLAINAHGGPGQIAINGMHNKHQFLTVPSLLLPDVRDNLLAIMRSTSPDATIIFMGCIAGQGLPGTALVLALSTLMPGRTIAAFATVGFSHGALQKRIGEPCANPGMRDTNSLFPSPIPALEIEHEKNWGDLNVLPWASESSPHAKVARNGMLIRDPGI